MTSREIRQKFVDFFVSRGHKLVSSSSLIPQNDPSVLLTSAGMQQFKPYFAGVLDSQKDFGNKNLVSVQKCFRTTDIEEVGKTPKHLTFFEMLGNFSIGGYGKKEAILYAWEFITEELKISKEKLFATVFSDKNNIPEDLEAYKIWQEVAPNVPLKKFGREDNFWGPTGSFGPCGPCSEIHYRLENGIDMELWNLVFTQYIKEEDGSLKDLGQVNIDTGMGLERMAMVLQEKPSVFETDLFGSMYRYIEPLVVNKISPSEKIILDHTRGAVFLIADGVEPSNVERGYILRRLIRRAMRHGRLLGVEKPFLKDLAKVVIDNYQNFFPELGKTKEEIFQTLQVEEEKFRKTLNLGLSEFEKIVQKDPSTSSGKISGKTAFYLYETYGFPPELTEELAYEKNLTFDKKKFEEEFKKHQEISRAGVTEKFKGGLIGESEQTVKYHTATHLLHQALRKVLGEHIKQAGSNITEERLRFDFTHPEKLTGEEIKKVEDMVNQKIQENLPVVWQEMKYEEAIKEGAIGLFGEKYSEIVKVYTIGNFSKEICGGPHVEKTGQIGHLKITKEENLGAGKRRIYVVVI